MLLSQWILQYKSTDIYIQWDGKTPYEETYSEGTYFWIVTGEYIDFQKSKAIGFVELLK
ncbi:MAG: hypothetical protein Crog4KO_19290 [Crocinitomicaceae bacterium]